MDAKWVMRTQGTLFEWLVKIGVLFKIDGIKNAVRLMFADSLNFRKTFCLSKKKYS